MNERGSERDRKIWNRAATKAFQALVIKMGMDAFGDTLHAHKLREQVDPAPIVGGMERSARLAIRYAEDAIKLAEQVSVPPDKRVPVEDLPHAPAEEIERLRRKYGSTVTAVDMMVEGARLTRQDMLKTIERVQDVRRRLQAHLN